MRFTSRDGRWRVDLIRLRLTSDNRDGERFRVAHDGYFIAEVATLDELARHVDLSELEVELSHAGQAHRDRLPMNTSLCRQLADRRADEDADPLVGCADHEYPA
jgi:hypothetical protein